MPSEDKRWEWSDDEGSVEIRALAEGVVWVRITERLSEGTVPVFNVRLPPLLETEDVYLFFDAADLNSFSNAARSAITEMLRNRLDNIAAVHVLVRSALIGMAVSATSLALGGKVHSFRDQAKFADTLRTIAGTRDADPHDLPY